MNCWGNPDAPDPLFDHAPKVLKLSDDGHQKGDVPRRIGRTKGGLNSKLHVVCDGDGRPLAKLLSEGQMSDHIGAKLLYPKLPRADKLIADKGCDSEEFREVLVARYIEAGIPSKCDRKVQHAFDRQV